MATLLLLYLAHLAPTLGAPVQQPPPSTIEKQYDLCTSTPSACKGIIGGIIAFVVLALLLVWYIWRRRKRRRKAKAEAEAARLKEIADKKQQKETEHIVNKTQLAMTRKMLEIQPP